MTTKTVFISYSHDSDEHREKVLSLSERLRQDGIVTLLDQYVNGSPKQGWPRWMLDQLDAADAVLLVCTEAYYRRFRGHEEPGKGKGADWEGRLITQEIYDSRSQTLKFVPVFLSAAVEDQIPEPLRSGTHYALTSESAYQSLYDFLLGQAGVEPQPVGAPKTRLRRKATPLTFDEPPASELAKPDISRIIKYAPAQLIGREAETKLLTDAWEKAARGETKRAHVLTLVALGGRHPGRRRPLVPCHRHIQTRRIQIEIHEGPQQGNGCNSREDDFERQRIGRLPYMPPATDGRCRRHGEHDRQCDDFHQGCASSRANRFRMISATRLLEGRNV